MMKKYLSILATGFFVALTAGAAQATLTTIGTATYNGNDYNLIWEDSNNGNSLVWLDYSNAANTWQNQVAWAAGLNAGGSGWTFAVNPGYTINWDGNEWRLPDAGTVPQGGFYITNSEMGYLFYTELGNKGHTNTDGSYNTTPPAPDYYFQNKSDFENLIAYVYWSSSEWAYDKEYGAWFFNTIAGFQSTAIKSAGYYGVAVRSGQVSENSAAPVPEPSTILLFGTGIAGLAGVRKRNNRIRC